MRAASIGLLTAVLIGSFSIPAKAASQRLPSPEVSPREWFNVHRANYSGATL